MARATANAGPRRRRGRPPLYDDTELLAEMALRHVSGLARSEQAAFDQVARLVRWPSAADQQKARDRVTDIYALERRQLEGTARKRLQSGDRPHGRDERLGRTLLTADCGKLDDPRTRRAKDIIEKAKAVIVSCEFLGNVLYREVLVGKPSKDLMSLFDTLGAILGQHFADRQACLSRRNPELASCEPMLQWIADGLRKVPARKLADAAARVKNRNSSS